MDAVRARNDYRFGRSRLRVEIARGASGPPAAPPNWRKKGTGFRIIVEGLPRHASWQDLKVRCCSTQSLQCMCFCLLYCTVQLFACHGRCTAQM